MTTPNTEATEPSLVEAFSEFSEALVAEEDGQQPGAAAPTGAEAEGGKPEQQAAAPQDASAQQPGQQAPAADAKAEQAKPEDAQVNAQQADALPERQPLSYTVNGQARSFEGGYIVPGYGALITNEAVPRLQDRLQQADRLVQQNQALYGTTQEYQKLGGRAGYEKLQSEKAMLDASGALLLRALTDDNTLVALATDPVARQQLMKELQLTAREAMANAQTAFRESFTRETEAGQAVQRTQTAIHNAVAYLAQQYTGLSDEDVATVRQHAARMHAAIVRPATPDEAREANVQVGAPIIDLNTLDALLVDRHTLRQRLTADAQRRQTDARENAARQAAAAPTTVVGAKPTPRPGNGKAPVQQKKGIDAMSSAELTRAMKSGRIFDLIGNDDET